MDIKRENIVGTYKLKDGNKYIFLMDKTVYLENINGELTKIELTQENIKKIKDDIGTGKTDIEK